MHVHTDLDMHAFIGIFSAVGLPGQFVKVSECIVLEKKKYFVTRLFLSYLTLFQFLPHIIARLGNSKHPLLPLSS